MRSANLQVLAKAKSIDLTTLGRARRELGTERKDDAKLRDWISENSELIATKIDRVLAKETVLETWRPGMRYNDYFALDFIYGSHAYAHTGQSGRPLVLSRAPVDLNQPFIVTIDGVVQTDPATWEIEAPDGPVPWPTNVWRLSGGYRIPWAGMTITIQYTGGYQLVGELPRPIESALLLLLRHRYLSADRDPTIRSEDVTGILSTQYWVGAIGDDAALPPEVCAKLEPYWRHAV